MNNHWFSGWFFVDIYLRVFEILATRRVSYWVLRFSAKTQNHRIGRVLNIL
jgi:hypothetical protein